MKSKNEKLTLVATTFFGLEEVLEKEIASIGGSEIEKLNRAVRFKGNIETVYRANFYLRTAIRVLVEISTFKILEQQDLYDNVQKIDWSQYLDVLMTLSVESVVSQSIIAHSQFVSQRVKDAIVDQFRKIEGKRPSVDPAKPDVKINVHLNRNWCTISLDSSGEPLFKRGYRQEHSEAPLNESLAAGLILMSGWDGKNNILDPMCGSATFLIETAMIAYKIPPGAFRTEFGFMNWRDFDFKLWDAVCNYPKPKITPTISIIGCENDFTAARIARKNIEAAGLQEYIKIRAVDFSEYEPQEKATIITNPPYNVRIKSDDINALYSKIGAFLKHKCAGSNAWILSGNPEAVKSIGLKPSSKTTVYNGQIKCTFMEFKLFQGKHSEWKRTDVKSNSNQRKKFNYGNEKQGDRSAEKRAFGNKPSGGKFSGGTGKGDRNFGRDNRRGGSDRGKSDRKPNY